MSRAARLDDPDSLGGLIEELGWPATERLVLLWAGQRKYISRSLLEDAELIAEIGAAAVGKLVDTYCGERLCLPGGLRSQIIARRMAAEGQSRNAIAAATGLTYRGVQKMLAREAPAVPIGRARPPALPLFDGID